MYAEKTLYTCITWRSLCSRDVHADYVILFILSPKISNAVRSAISVTAGLLVTQSDYSAWSCPFLVGFRDRTVLELVLIPEFDQILLNISADVMMLSLTCVLTAFAT